MIRNSAGLSGGMLSCQTWVDRRGLPGCRRCACSDVLLRAGSTMRRALPPKHRVSEWSPGLSAPQDLSKSAVFLSQSPISLYFLGQILPKANCLCKGTPRSTGDSSVKGCAGKDPTVSITRPLPKSPRKTATQPFAKALANRNFLKEVKVSFFSQYEPKNPQTSFSPLPRAPWLQPELRTTDWPLLALACLQHRRRTSLLPKLSGYRVPF